jgi:hypothetical protein
MSSGGVEECMSVTIPCLLEAMPGIVVTGINVDRVTKFLQSKSSVHDKAFGAA